MTLLQLRTLCLDWLDDPNGSYFTSSVLNLRLNLAQKECQKRLISANKEYYLTCVKSDTVANQQLYSLPSDFMQVVRLEWYESGTSGTSFSNWIAPMTPNQRDLLDSVQGDPQYYSMNHGNLLLWPIPNRIVEVHLEYSYLVADMSLDADSPDAPDYFHEYIAILATRDCLIKDGRPLDPIKSKMDQYELLFKQIADQRQADQPRMVTQTQSWGGWGM